MRPGLLRAVVVVGGLGFSGVLLVLPNPVRRRVLAYVDRITDEICAAAAATWSDPGEVAV